MDFRSNLEALSLALLARSSSTLGNGGRRGGNGVRRREGGSNGNDGRHLDRDRNSERHTWTGKTG